MVDRNRNSPLTARERFLELLCSNTSALFMLLIVCIILLVLSGISFLFLDPGTPSYVLLQIDLVLLVGFIAVISWLFNRCYQHRV